MRRVCNRGVATALTLLVATCVIVAQSFAFGGALPKLGPTELVDVSTAGEQADGEPVGFGVSATGRYVVFGSGKSTNLAPPGRQGVYVRDVQRNVTELIALDAADSGSGLAITGNGRFVSYVGADGLLRVVDRTTGLAEEITAGVSQFASLSATGRWVGFSTHLGLVPEDQNGIADVYLYDRQLRRFERVSVPNAGGEANDMSVRIASISVTGRFVLFSSYASNLVGNDSNGIDDVFLRDRWTGRTELISMNQHGVAGNGTSSADDISADGRLVVFHSAATDLVRGYGGPWIGYFRDRWSGRTYAVPGFSPDSIDAIGLIAAGYDGTGIALYNLLTGARTRVSVPPNGEPNSTSSYIGIVSDDAGSVTFYSEAGNLTPDDLNPRADIFTRDVCWLLCAIS